MVMFIAWPCKIVRQFRINGNLDLAINFVCLFIGRTKVANSSDRWWWVGFYVGTFSASFGHKSSVSIRPIFNLYIRLRPCSENYYKLQRYDISLGVRRKAVVKSQNIYFFYYFIYMSYPCNISVWTWHQGSSEQIKQR